jgi:hypothetical protein
LWTPLVIFFSSLQKHQASIVQLAQRQLEPNVIFLLSK